MSRVPTLLFPSCLIPLVTSFIMVPYIESLKHIFFINTSISYFVFTDFSKCRVPTKIAQKFANC